MEDNISPNTTSAVAETNAVPSLDSIAEKMTAMRSQTKRNLLDATEPTATGAVAEAEEATSPVAPNSEDAVPEIDDSYNQDLDDGNQVEEDTQQTAVSGDSNDSTADELIDFIEFADSNPNAKFKFMRNGKEVVIDAKKAAAILGQGSAIHEEARQLKIEKSEFDEYLKETRARQEGLTLAMEFTVQPKLKQAYDEIVKTQNYQATFYQQLQATQDPAQQARIQANMQQNEQYIRQQQQIIGQLKPAVDQFREVRKEQVKQVINNSRKQFQDKELKNEYVFNELRDKLGKVWKGSAGEIIPGVSNIDLISSDETLLSLVRDGLKYRDKPQTKSAGASVASLTNRKGTTTTSKSPDGDISKLREQAKAGDKKAADNLLMAQLQRIRAGRGSR